MNALQMNENHMNDSLQQRSFIASVAAGAKAAFADPSVHSTSIWRQAMTPTLSPLFRALACCGLALGSTLCHALEAHPGDAVAPPPGMGLVGLYAIHQDLDPLRAQGRDVAGPTAKADVALLRLFYATKIGEVQVNPQVVLPYGRIAGGGTLSSVPSESGLGDVSVLASIMLHQDPASKTSVYVLPGVVLKTGAYDPAKLSIGQNRMKYLVQLGAQTGLGKDWIVDGYADITAFGTNSRNAGGELKQRPLLTLQSYLRYAAAPGTELAAGLRYYSGGETRVANVDQNDRISQTAMLLTASHWLDGKTQLMANWGKDLRMSNGFKTSTNIELRAIRLF
jgi:hypothetical protein